VICAGPSYLLRAIYFVPDYFTQRNIETQKRKGACHPERSEGSIHDSVFYGMNRSFDFPPIFIGVGGPPTLVILKKHPMDVLFRISMSMRFSKILMLRVVIYFKPIFRLSQCSRRSPYGTPPAGGAEQSWNHATPLASPWRASSGFSGWLPASVLFSTFYFSCL